MLCIGSEYAEGRWFSPRGPSLVEDNGFQLASSTMGNAHALEKHQLPNVGSGTTGSVGLKDFESRWKSFMNSLDLSAEHIKQIELLDEEKKAELLSNYVLKKLFAYFIPGIKKS
ncbi:unnamed protein product [Schistosoma mattheei]|uniref:Uncharacterized protein n=1 Tax=Schistosoma mattheei TaxID=31246 RepID=A0A183P310_9TREM|nr:unnamed protein product [Schistosoma mattheei]